MKSVGILFFTLYVIGLLSILCAFFSEDGVAVAGRRVFFPTLEEVMVKEKSRSVTEKLQHLEAMIAWNDSVQAAYTDSLKFFNDFFETNPARLYFPANDSTWLLPVFEALDSATAGRSIHILHYGDSQIESDRITGFLRQLMQERFGGNGPGLLPAVQPIPSYTVSQDASGDLQRYIISGNLINKAPHNRYGILGQLTEVGGHASLTVIPRKNKDAFKNLQTFSRVRLFVGNNSAGFEARLHAGGHAQSPKTISKAGAEMKILDWTLPAPVSKVSLQLTGSAEITAISLDGNSGVSIDNIPLRGSSGTFFTEIDPASIMPALGALDVPLILLEFGGNTVPAINGERGVEFYSDNIAKQIAAWRKLCPDAKIIFIGPSDMSTKIKGRLQTYPCIPILVEALKQVVNENGAAFWNMYDVMGGENSMIDWVNERPQLASSDHIHFTQRGANRIAELFFRSLMLYYDYYSFQKSDANVGK
jgi:lysophospholipase L1-like esterase